MYQLSTKAVNVTKIKGIPEIPGAQPFVGHLPMLGGRSGKADSAVWTEWSDKYGWEIFQLRFGQERVVVANTYSMIKEIWVSNSSASISRPIPYTIEKFVGREMGAAPWDCACKRQRGAALKSVSPGTWKSYYPAIDEDICSVIKQVGAAGQDGKKAIELSQYLSLVGLNLGCRLTYGKSVQDLGGMDFLHGFIEAASKITEVRVGSSNWVDYIPLLRLFPSRTVRRAVEGVRDREPYLQKLYDGMKRDIDNNAQINCIGAKLLSDKDSKLTTDDIKATCISMLQGSSETIAGTLSCGLGSLCGSDNGMQLQDQLHEAIIKRWGTSQEAFDKSFEGEDIPLVVATYKEMLRYYCIVTFALPRKAIRDIKLKNGTIIPKDTTLLMNAEGGSHDPKFYGPDAGKFNPYRYMDPESSVSTTALPHFAYGAGSRICPAMQISNRILYALIIRLIVSFKFVASEEMRPIDHPVKYNQAPASLVAKQKPYLVCCIPRKSLGGKLKEEQE